VPFADINEVKIEEPKKSEMLLTWELFKSKRMLTAFPIMMYSAISMSTYQSNFVPLMNDTMPDHWDDDKKLQ
jgi:hypothetical protein